MHRALKFLAERETGSETRWFLRRNTFNWQVFLRLEKRGYCKTFRKDGLLRAVITQKGRAMVAVLQSTVGFDANGPRYVV